MFGITVSAFMLAFGVFLKVTKNPGFAQNKKFAWIFIGIGLISLIFKILHYK
ncbi:divalent metal cation (Fe/Co/Zn/Cd) transporter [Chryseobacterium sp. SLBN-27]|nr:divalent metal cation (Fe/Co/Zn/Cd) transporter [Chryseobacterium sp. SLBN-27]